MKRLFALIFSIALLSSCNTNTQKAEAVADESTSGHKVIVKEVLQTSAYTYLFVNEGEQDYWMAATKMDIKVDAILYYDIAMLMQDFQSKELDRFFDRILFVQEIGTEPIVAKVPTLEQASQGMPKPVIAEEDIQVEPVEGSITIAELYKNRMDYANKKVMVRGKVVKVNEAIMSQNWVHLQDGTKDGSNFDLTITTQALPKVSDIVIFEGTVTLNKDFGSGYSYELIIEGASLK